MRGGGFDQTSRCINRPVDIVSFTTAQSTSMVHHRRTLAVIVVLICVGSKEIPLFDTNAGIKQQQLAQHNARAHCGGRSAVEDDTK